MMNVSLKTEKATPDQVDVTQSIPDELEKDLKNRPSTVKHWMSRLPGEIRDKYFNGFELHVECGRLRKTPLVTPETGSARPSPIIYKISDMDYSQDRYIHRNADGYLLMRDIEKDTNVSTVLRNEIAEEYKKLLAD